MTRRSITNIGECPRRGCDHTITVYEEGEIAGVLTHKCKGKPFTTKEKPNG